MSVFIKREADTLILSHSLNHISHTKIIEHTLLLHFTYTLLHWQLQLHFDPFVYPFPHSILWASFRSERGLITFTEHWETVPSLHFALPFFLLSGLILELVVDHPTHIVILIVGGVLIAATHLIVIVRLLSECLATSLAIWWVAIVSLVFSLANEVITEKNRAATIT